MTNVSDNAQLISGIAIALQLAKNWELNPQQTAQLIGVNKDDIAHCKAIVKGDLLATDYRHLTYRLSYLLNFQAYIENYVPKPEWNQFVHETQEALGGLRPIDVLCSAGTDDTRSMIDYLNASVQGHYL